MNTTRSSNTKLRSLLSNKPLTQTFNESQYTYSASIAASVPSITINPTLQDANATLNINSIASTN